MQADTSTPETALADVFAMNVETLTVVKIGSMFTASLRLAGLEDVRYCGNPGESWRDALSAVIDLAVKNQQAHV